MSPDGLAAGGVTGVPSSESFVSEAWLTARWFTQEDVTSWGWLKAALAWAEAVALRIRSRWRLAMIWSACCRSAPSWATTYAFVLPRFWLRCQAAGASSATRSGRATGLGVLVARSSRLRPAGSGSTRVSAKPRTATRR
jgi:hypothetical protein